MSKSKARARGSRRRNREVPRPVAVIDVGAAAIKMLIAEAPSGRPVRILEEVSRGVLLGKDTFTKRRLGADTVAATLKALDGFRRIMDTYGVERSRAVATSALREAQNRDTVLDRIKLRTGIDLEVIDGPEENRLTYIAVREALRGHLALRSQSTLLVEIGGGSADLSFLRGGQPRHSGTYALGSVRMRQSLASWKGSHEQWVRLLQRHVKNVIEDILRALPLRKVQHFIALGGDVRFAASQMLGKAERAESWWVVPRDAFLRFCEEAARSSGEEELVDRYQLSQADAETLVPALIAYRELLSHTRARSVIVPDTTLRRGLLLDMVGGNRGPRAEAFRKQVVTSAKALGERYRYDAAHAEQVARLATRLFDELRDELGLGDHERLLLEVAALLHDIGIYVNLRAHHKHSQYLIEASELFGLARDDLQLIGNIARYHRRATPQKTHLLYSALSRDDRIVVSKLAALLRFANALDADHAQRIKNVKLLEEDGMLVTEVVGRGDLTMERLATSSRDDLLTELLGRTIRFREATKA